MTYQDVQHDQGDLIPGPPVSGETVQTEPQPNNARTIQIIIAVGFVVAILVAVFGSTL